MRDVPGRGVCVQGFEFRVDRAYDPVGGYWVQEVAPDIVRVGVHALTAQIFGGSAHCALDPKGARAARGEVFGSVEAGAIAWPLIAPVGGVVHLVNEGVVDNPEFLLADPYGDGWLVEIAEPAESGLDLLLTGSLAAEWFEQTVRARHEHRRMTRLAAVPTVPRWSSGRFEEVPWQRRRRTS
ncbi:MAG: glycine cleavage system protein H [Sporichthyaceae bacterium]